MCGVRYDEHSGMDHRFNQRPDFKQHIPLPRLDLTHCGWLLVDVSDALVNDVRDVVRRAVRRNTVCLTCLKVWLYFRERAKLYA